MAADITVRARTVPSVRRRRCPPSGCRGASWGWCRGGDDRRAAAVPALDRALPAGLSRAADRERHAGGAGARRHARQHGDRGGQARLLNHARVDAVVLVEPNKPRRALLNIAPRPDMPTFNLKERGALGLIWDALGAMTRDGAYYTRIGGESMRLPRAMVWIVVDELPMRIAMYDYSVPRAGAVDHHRAVHRRPALSRAALAGDPAAAGSVGRHGGLPPRSRGGAAPTGRAPTATTRSAWSTASSRTCSASCAPRCARSRGWPRSARPRTRSTTTCATSCRPRGCCRTAWPAATTSARASSRRPS